MHFAHSSSSTTKSMKYVIVHPPFLDFLHSPSPQQTTFRLMPFSPSNRAPQRVTKHCGIEVTCSGLPPCWRRHSGGRGWWWREDAEGLSDPFWPLMTMIPFCHSLALPPDCPHNAATSVNLWRHRTKVPSCRCPKTPRHYRWSPSQVWR